jgi:hypothetical protein
LPGVCNGTSNDRQAGRQTGTFESEHVVIRKHHPAYLTSGEWGKWKMDAATTGWVNIGTLGGWKENEGEGEGTLPFRFWRVSDAALSSRELGEARVSRVSPR